MRLSQATVFAFPIISLSPAHSLVLTFSLLKKSLGILL